LENFEIVPALAQSVLRTIADAGGGKHSEFFLLSHLRESGVEEELDRIYRIKTISIYNSRWSQLRL
jgi:hypothetical protein